MAKHNPRGFVPTRTLDGRIDFRTQLRATNGNNGAHIFPGDLVTMTTAGSIDRWPGTNDATQKPIGVARAVYNTNKRPFTFSQPDNGPFLPASTAGFVDVIEDPDVIYTIHMTTSAGVVDSLMDYFAASAGSPTSAAGRSGFLMDAAATTQPSDSHPLQLLAVSTNELDSPAAGVSANDVEVRIAHHRFQRT